MAWSPYKNRIISYVVRHPGCSKWDVAKHCTYARRRNPSKQYYLVNTALRNGWIAGERQGRSYALFLPQVIEAADQFGFSRTTPPGILADVADERGLESLAKQLREVSTY